MDIKNLNVQIEDVAFFRSIKPNAMEVYLRLNGWTKVNEKENFGTYYKKEETITMIPFHPVNKFYLIRVRDWFRVVSKEEKRTQLELAEEVDALKGEYNATDDMEAIADILYDALSEDYVREMREAVEEAKKHRQNVKTSTGLDWPLYTHSRVIAVFREYWLKTARLSDITECSMNPAHLTTTASDLPEEIEAIVRALPYYPIGSDKEGFDC